METPPYNDGMATVRPIRPVTPPPVALHDHAMDNLRYIRETMERAASFTAVPGVGGMVIGSTALAAALVASRQPGPGGWLALWLGEGLLACLIGLAAAALKSRRLHMALLSGPGRKFLWGFAPPLAVGGLLTLALSHAGAYAMLPGVWMLLYGTGVVTGGAASVRVVPLMGLCFMGAGTAALFAPAGMENWFLAAGFGGLHLLFGTIITVRYGG
jgi:hypothetical protein